MENNKGDNDQLLRVIILGVGIDLSFDNITD